jgi:two-component system, cell cycle sensor histidine kinase and response regulator CckA
MDVPVVFLTAHSDEATLNRAGLSEPFGYFLKPFDARDLRATLQMAHYRHCAESRLRKMERWLTNTLRSIGDAVIATDCDGCITFINSIAEAMTGWTHGAALGLHLSEVAVTATDGSREIFQLLDRAMTDGVVITLGEGRCLRTRDGRMMPVDYTLAPIRGDQGWTIGYVVIFRENSALLEVEKSAPKLETPCSQLTS